MFYINNSNNSNSDHLIQSILIKWFLWNQINQFKLNLNLLLWNLNQTQK